MTTIVLEALGREVGQLLKAQAETIGVAESSTGGLIGASLLSIAGASGYFAGSAVAYTASSRRQLLGLSGRDVAGMEPMSVEVAEVFAQRTGETFNATWGLAELGAAGPTGTRFGHPPGTCVIAVDGPVALSEVIRSDSALREDNMWECSRRALALLAQALRANSRNCVG